MSCLAAALVWRTLLLPTPFWAFWVWRISVLPAQSGCNFGLANFVSANPVLANCGGVPLRKKKECRRRFEIPTLNRFLQAAFGKARVPGAREARGQTKVQRAVWEGQLQAICGHQFDTNIKSQIRAARCGGNCGKEPAGGVRRL